MSFMFWLALAQRKILCLSENGSLIHRAHGSRLIWQRMGVHFVSFLGISYAMSKKVVLNFRRESHGLCRFFTVEFRNLQFVVSSAILFGVYETLPVRCIGGYANHNNPYIQLTYSLHQRVLSEKVITSNCQIYPHIIDAIANKVWHIRATVRITWYLFFYRFYSTI